MGNGGRESAIVAGLVALALTAACARAPIVVAPTTPARPSDEATDGAGPPWPEVTPGTKLSLTWTVHAPRPDPAHPDDESLSRRVVELVARIGGVVRRVRLAPLAGSLFENDQSLCHRELLEAGEVASIGFYLGGVTGYLVRRAPDDTITIHVFQATDGLCVDPAGQTIACPRPTKAVASLKIPANVEIVEALVVRDAAGNEEPYACSQ